MEAPTATPAGTIPAGTGGNAAPGEGPERARGGSAVVALFAATIFLSSALVFLIQPMLARMIAPLYGGAPAVWNTSLVFFQAVLLAGYAWAHWSTRLLGVRRQAMAQLLVLALPLLLLPFALPGNAAPPDDQPPALWLLYALTLAVGVPYFVVTTASPLLQRWFSHAGHGMSADPYFLYAAGNAGSLLGLLAYPTLLEPALALRQQRLLWAVIYAAFVLVAIACIVLVLVRTRSQVAEVGDGRDARDVKVAAGPSATTGPSATAGKSADTPGAPGASSALRTRAGTMALAFVPSSLMLGVTTYITTDVASVPFFWAVPLAVYLLTFVIAFSGSTLLTPTRAGWGLVATIVPFALAPFGVLLLPIWLRILLHLSLLFFAGVLAHGRLAAMRPPASQLTGFYLLISVGGVLGGSFNALLAPVVFETVIEYPLVIIAAFLMRVRTSTGAPAWQRTWLPAALVVAAIAMRTAVLVAPQDIAGAQWLLAGAMLAAMVLTAWRPLYFTAIVAAVIVPVSYSTSVTQLAGERTFFGVLRVLEDERGLRLFSHGTTVHGTQWTSGPYEGEPTTYYSRRGPLGDVFGLLQEEGKFDRMAVMGLGAGTMATYGERGQSITYFEIDPAVIRMARDPQLFTYVTDTPADVSFERGDGRLELARQPNGSYDLVVLDVFSSDMLPVHLITREAIASYAGKVEGDAPIVFNVSSNFLELAPVVGAAADSLGLAAAIRVDSELAQEDYERGYEPSTWVVMSRSQQRLAPLLATGRWQQLERPAAFRTWTDDYSNVLGVVRWGGLPQVL